MRHEARDAEFDRMLGSSLRGSLREGSDACPDAETLAAWSGNGLLPPQRIQLEAHLAECARCQAQIAALARSESAAAPSPARAWNWLTWRWLVPAAAGAAALFVWIVARPGSPRLAQPSISPSSAKVEAPSATGPAPLEVTPDARADALAPSQSPARPAAEPRTSVARSRAQVNEVATPPESQRAKADRQESAGNEPPAVTERRALAAAPSPATPVAKIAEQVALLEIASSDRSVRWRIRGSEVERTADAGATWTKQTTNTTALIAAGASPSPDVCWLAGGRGTVLRSIDGRTWQTVPFPEPTDLVQIEAAGPEEATVTTSDARHFTTVDGGATWTRRELQEF